MTIITTLVRVTEDGTLSGRVSADVPAGEHEAFITVERGPCAFDVTRLPSIDLGPWPADAHLRREDLYGDDGR